MSELHRRFRGHRQAGSLSRDLAPMRFVSENAYATKAGEYCTILKVGGFNHETVETAKIRLHSEAFGTAISSAFDEQFHIYQYILKANAPPIATRQDYGAAKPLQLLNRRAAFIESRRNGMYSVDLYLAVLYCPGALAKLTGLSVRENADKLSAHSREAIDHLADRIHSFTVQLSDLMTVGVLGKDETFTFLRRLVNLDRERADSVQNCSMDEQLAWRIGDPGIEIHSGHLMVDDKYIKSVALKTVPMRTHANMLHELLTIDCNFIACSEWQAQSNFVMRKEIVSRKKNFDASILAIGTIIASVFSEQQERTEQRLQDKSADRHIDTLDDALIEIENNGRHYGLFSVTVAFYGETLPAVRRACAEMDRVFGRYGANLVHERMNLYNSYLSLIPGNHFYNVRKLYVHDQNYSDLSFIWTQSQGNPRNEHLHGECLSVFETNTRQPYYFNLHVNDLCGAMLTGRTGSGKTFLAQRLIADLQKCHPKILILDIAGSYRGLVQSIGGAYYRLSAQEQDAKINPFCLEASPDNFQFLFEFVKMMLTNEDHYEFSDAENRDLFNGIRGLYRLPLPMRYLSNLVLPPQLNRRLSRWKRTEQGQYGAFFDNAEDTLSLANLTCVEFHQMDDKYIEVLNLMQFYLMQRWDAVLFDPQLLGTFKLLFADEGWRFALRTKLADYFIAKTKTNRAQNAGFLFATHSPLDTDRVGIAKLLTEACPMQILLYNPDISVADYREHFKLTQREIDLVMRLKEKRQFLARTAEGSVILNHHSDEETKLLFATDPDSQILKREMALAAKGAA